MSYFFKLLEVTLAKSKQGFIHRKQKLIISGYTLINSNSTVLMRNSDNHVYFSILPNKCRIYKNNKDKFVQKDAKLEVLEIIMKYSLLLCRAE